MVVNPEEPMLPMGIEDLSALLPLKGALFGIDFGSKTIGLAISDIRRTISTPFVTLRRKNTKTDIEALKCQVIANNIQALIVGWPLNMDGRQGPRTQATQSFMRAFTAVYPVRYVLWDERLTTAQAHRMMVTADSSRAKRAEKIDQVAASLILQSALDRLADLAGQF